jgi:beta-lactamase regulating signal transducer with metallopeptidase domain
MNWLGMQGIAQVSVERVLNSLPEGLLIALFAWLLLRLMGRQNSGTRFAVWFMALMAVAGLSCLGGFRLDDGRLLPTVGHVGPQIIVPALWAAVIFAVWALAAFLALARVAAGLWQVWAIRRSSTEINLPQLGPAAEETFQQHSAGKSVCLVLSERVKVPAAIGFWKPAIILPAWTLEQLSANELQSILIHELTHLKRRDDWTNLLQKIVRAVFFFHPAVWWIDGRLSLEREMACDDAVLANTGNPRAYASCLIELLEKSCARRGWTMAQAAVHRAQELSLRITQILDAKRPATTRIWKPALALTSVFSLVCFVISYCAPRLVAFGPTTSAPAIHLAKTGLHSDETDLTGMRPTVIPASFDVPASAPIERHLPMIPKTTKRHRLAALRQHQATAPRTAMVHVFESTARRNAVPIAQMVVFVETGHVRYEQKANYGNPQTNAAAWQTRVWQIVLIAPAQNEAQAEVIGNLI